MRKNTFGSARRTAGDVRTGDRSQSPLVLSALVVGCLLLAAALGAVSVAEMVSMFGVLGIGAVTTIGDLTESNTPDDLKVRDVSDIITKKRPDRNPLWVTMRRLRKGKRAQAEKVEWVTDDIIPRNTTVTNNVAAGAAGAAVEWEVANASLYIVDDLIQLPVNATAADAIVQVTEVDASTNTIKVVRVDGGTDTAWGTVPAVSAGEFIRRIGNAKPEFYNKSSARTTQGYTEYNYVERRDAVIAISNTKKATKSYMGDDWANSKDKQLYDFLSSGEEKLFFGKRQLKKIGNERRGFMGGILSYSLPKSYTYQTSTFDVAAALEIARDLKVGNDGSPVRYLHCDSVMMTDWMLLDRDRVRVNEIDSKTLRVPIPEFDFGFLKIRLVHEQIFDDAGRERFGVFLDYANLTLRDLNPMKAVLIDLEKTVGQDGQALQIKEECTIEVRYLETHGVINGSA